MTDTGNPSVKLLQVQRWVARASQLARTRLNLTGQVYVTHRVSEYRAMWQAVASELGASFSELADDLWELELRGRRMRVLNDILEFDNMVTLVIAGRKPLTYSLLRQQGLRVPDHVVFRLSELNRAYAFLDAHKEGCVIKPAHGTSSGQGVTMHVMTQKEARRAAILASLYCQDLLIEPVVFGECYRVLVFRGKVLHAVKRRGLRIEGDGSHSIEQLIAACNAKRRSDGLPAIEVDRDCRFTLRAQGLTFATVPDAGKTVLLRSSGDATCRAELRTVYDETVTDSIGDALRATAEHAARILGSDLLGVDFITPDASVSLEQSGGVLNEVNTTPGLHHHYHASSERYPQAAVPIAAELLGAS
jgi:cyanophycin synthetase